MDVHGAVDEALVGEIEGLVAGQKTLEEVVRWGLLSRPARLVAKIVVQDEYTHDVVIPYRGEVYLAYDTT